MSLLRFTGGRGGHGSTSGGPVANPLIGRIVSGDYDGKLAKLYATTSGFPHPGSDTLLATYTLASPAAGAIISLTEIVINLVSVAATIAARSPTSQANYLVIDPTGTTPIWLSFGLSSSGFDARVVCNDMNMFAGDTLNLTSLHIVAASVLDHYLVTPSPSSGIVGGASYQAIAQAKDASGNDLHILGRSIVGSYVAVSGAGSNGSVDATPAVSNRFGVFEPIACVAGGFPKTEKTHVVDGDGFAGNSANLVILDVVDSYVLTLVTLVPGPGTTKVLQAQARVNGSDTAVAGRVITWSKSGLTGATFGTPTSTTNASGIAFVNVTFGSVGSTGTLIATDAQGETGTSQTVTVTTAAPVYHHLTSASPNFTGAPQDSASITVPANGWIVVRAHTCVDIGATFTCAGSGLSFSTPSGGSVVLTNAFAGFDQTARVFVAQAGGGGFTGPLTFSSSGGDKVFLVGWEIGYFEAAEVNGTFLCYNGNFAADGTTKTLAFGVTPGVTSTCLAAWGTHLIGSLPGFWTPKSSPAWTEDSDSGTFQSGFGARLGAHSFAGSDTPASATPVSGFGLQVAVIIEVEHA